MGWFFVTVACLAGLGLLRMTRAGARSREYLDGARDEPLQIEHLSRAMQDFVTDTRLLRISLESNVRTIAQFIDGDLEATNDDRDNFDQMLMNVTRAVAEWLSTVDRMSEADQSQIVDRGGNPASVRAALEREGWSFERRNLKMAGSPPMHVRLQAVMAELHRVELALQQTARIYR